MHNTLQLLIKPKKAMTAFYLITPHQALEHSMKDYNPSLWEKMIQKKIEQQGEFYLAPANEIYSYDRMYCKYLTKDKLRLLMPISFSSTLTNGGYYGVNIISVTPDGKTIKDLMLPNMSGDDLFELIEHVESYNRYFISSYKFNDPSGGLVTYNNSFEARKQMIYKCAISETVCFTKELL